MVMTCEPLQISVVRDLPALPVAVLSLLDTLRRDDIDTRALAAKISVDQAFTAKTLRLANSSFYAVPRRVTSVTDAINVLGLRTVRTVVTAAALAGSFKAPTCAGFDFMAFWRHAVGTAVGAKLVANAIGADAEAAFTAGLMHDIGQLVLAGSFPDRFAQVLAHHAASSAGLGMAEHVLLGTDHAAVGRLVAEHWNFPKSIADAIGNHHAPPMRAGAVELVHIVNVADQLVHAAKRSGDEGEVLPAACKPAWVGIGLPAESWGKIFTETEVQAQAVCGALLN